MLEKTLKMVDKNIWYLGLAVFASYALINNQGFPYLGSSLSIAGLATLVFGLKEKKDWFVQALYFCTLLFAFFIVYRANEFLTLLNIVAALTCGSLLSRIQSDDKGLGFGDALIAPFSTVVTSLFATKYQYNIKQLRHRFTSNSLRHIKWTSLIQSLVISVVILLIILPLLASANPVFASWLNYLIDLLSLGFIGELWTAGGWEMWFWRILVFIFFAYLIPRLVVFANTYNTYLHNTLLQSVNMLIPQVVVAVVIGIFFVSQAQLYFAGPEVLQSLGYTNSEQAREIFAQLSVVGVIILALIYNTHGRKSLARLLTYVLLVETVFLTLIALKSVGDYGLLWGLTYKRLWGFAGVIWILGTVAGFTYWYFQRLINSTLIKGVILWSGAVLLLVNAVNFDALINRFPPSEVRGMIDTEYLVMLSPDSHSYQEQVTRLQAEPQMNLSNNELTLRLYQLQMLSSKTTALKEKYTTLDWRTFNFSEYWEYLDTKELNLSSPIQNLETQRMMQIEASHNQIEQ